MPSFDLMIAKPVAAELRGVDAWGSGAFGAPRGSRTHRGLDFSADKGSFVFSPVEGFVSKIGFPYSDPKKIDYRYVAVVDADGYEHRFMYVKPYGSTGVGDKVVAGDLLGVVQGISDFYKGMKDHVHYEIKRDGKYRDPANFWRIKNAA